MKLKPFQNESQVVTVGNLEIENRLDRLSIHGTIDLTRDKKGFEAAKVLKGIIDAAVSTLEAEALPDDIALVPAKSVPNPFK